MKVGEIFEGNYDDASYDASNEAAQEYFNEKYISLPAVMSLRLEEIADYAHKANLSNEAEFLNKFVDMNDDDFYVPRDVGKHIDQLDTMIGNEDPNIVDAIEQLVALLSSNMTTEEEWMNSKEAHSVADEARAEYEPDEHNRYGIKPSDFY